MDEISKQFAEMVKVFLARINWFNGAEVPVYVDPGGALGYDNFEASLGQPVRIANHTGAVLDVTFPNGAAFGATQIIGIPVGKSVTIAVADDAPIGDVLFEFKRQGAGGAGDGGGPIAGIKPPPGG
jgi:hypothetical protein